MTFPECVRECFANRELLAEFDRLTGCNLSLRGSGLDLSIDFASGRFEGEIELFAAFVKEYVWNRIELDK